MMNILWADDQPDVAKSFARSLNMENCSFEYVSNGDDALEKILTSNYDLILIDLAMPPERWGGLWLLEKISELDINIISIVVSGEGTQSETIKALRLGASDYVTKDKLLDELPSQIALSLSKEAKKRKEMLAIIKAGESNEVEFKSTLRMNLYSLKKDPELELAVFKTITGFLNTSGGQLMVGVNDAGQILGLKSDGFSNNDKFELHFWSLFTESLGVEKSQLVKTEFIEVDNKSVFYVSCSKSDSPIFLNWKSSGHAKKQELFYVRTGPRTDLLGIRQALAYIESNFH